MSVTVHRVVAAYEQAQEEVMKVLRHMYRVSATKKMKFFVIRIRILRNYLLSFGRKSRLSKGKKRLLLQPLFHVMIRIWHIRGRSSIMRCLVKLK